MFSSYELGDLIYVILGKKLSNLSFSIFFYKMQGVSGRHVITFQNVVFDDWII